MPGAGLLGVGWQLSPEPFWRAEVVRKKLAAGEFVDRETGEAVLRLMEVHAWEVNLRALGDNELGLAGGQLWVRASAGRHW